MVGSKNRSSIRYQIELNQLDTANKLNSSGYIYDERISDFLPIIFFEDFLDPPFGCLRVVHGDGFLGLKGFAYCLLAKLGFFLKNKFLWAASMKVKLLSQEREGNRRPCSYLYRH